MTFDGRLYTELQEDCERALVVLKELYFKKRIEPAIVLDYVGLAINILEGKKRPKNERPI